MQRKFPGGEYYSTYEAGFNGTSTHEDLCKLGIKNIVVHPKCPLALRGVFL
ncbi:MAG TPA: hypothetical protein VHE34_30435 [Puia sp.]|uniref:hypothetical protein n=1 Tax=Puia sp. TaxID=2045100 RepID=UPI002B83DA85|nr:hypothetical protein [Puia sp.]HVU99593.1 hypothetical protein [Puia sp.]